MEKFFLPEIPFQIEPNHLLKQWRIEEGSEDATRIGDLIAEAQKIAKPKAFYKVAYIEAKGEDFVVIEGIKLTSRILRINLEQANRVFPFVATCGKEIDGWSERFNETLEHYWTDSIKEHILGSAIKFLNNHLKQHLVLESTSVMNPGSLADWPICEQEQLFKILGDVEHSVGVELTSSFLMIPTKSVSGIHFPTVTSFENCQLCPRENCPGRRAPYDQELYAKKYQDMNR